MSNAVHMEPFSASVFKVFFLIFATTTEICTRSHFTQACATGFTTSTHALLLIDASSDATMVGYRSPGRSEPFRQHRGRHTCASLHTASTTCSPGRGRRGLMESQPTSSVAKTAAPRHRSPRLSTAKATDADLRHKGCAACRGLTLATQH